MEIFAKIVNGLQMLKGHSQVRDNFLQLEVF